MFHHGGVILRKPSVLIFIAKAVSDNHGGSMATGTAVATGVLNHVTQCPACRIAQPSFKYQAFLHSDFHGKLV